MCLLSIYREEASNTGQVSYC